MTGWISVKDAMPAAGKRVLVYIAGGAQFGSMDSLGNWRKGHGGPMNAVPTHWMHIPPPQKQEQTDDRP